MARQTTQAVAEQARAMREIVKANTSVSANIEQVARGAVEQASAAAELAKATVQMRSSVHQTSVSLTEQAKATTDIGALAQTVTEITRRTVTGLTEQARGASEITRAIDEVRKQTSLTARALVEQSRGAKETENSARHVARTATELTNAMQEQASTNARLAERGGEVRRLADVFIKRSDLAKGGSDVGRALGDEATEGLMRAVDGVRQKVRAATAASSREVRSGTALDLELRHFTELATQLDEAEGDAGSRDAPTKERTS
jgi:methyl-accepting chemotaxis protein